jgi:Holliday junction resolvase RusA-like endonuclease
MNTVTVELIGDPAGQGRPRFTRNGVAYTPTGTRNTTATMRLLGRQAMEGRARFEEPVRIELLAEFAVPSSWSRKNQARALAGELRPGKKPDLSNILKLAEEALNGVCFRDDELIVEARLTKVYGPQPRVVVTVSEILG